MSTSTLVQNDDILRTFFYKSLFTQAHCEHALRAQWLPAEDHPYYQAQMQNIPGFAHYKPDMIQILAPGAASQWLRDSLHSITRAFNDRHYQFEANRLSEVQCMTLQAGKDMPWHYNLGIGPMALRKMCLTIILSPENAYQGGRFCSIVGSSAQPQGTVIVYPSMATVRMSPVTQGSLSFLFVTLDGDRPFR